MENIVTYKKKRENDNMQYHKSHSNIAVRDA